MKDIMSGRGAFTHRKMSGLSGGDDDINSSVWTTVRINKLLEEIDNGMDVKGLHNSPFKDNDINLKRANLPFEYTPEEWDELKKCKHDLLYFAYNYCMIQTDQGVQLVKDGGGLRDFQEGILNSFKKNKYNILMASRQTGKCLSMLSKVKVIDIKTNNQLELPLFEIYFESIKETRKLTNIEKLKYFLYKLI
jgi:hypothetical protein